MLEPGLRKNGLSSERKWEAKENQRRDVQRKTGQEERRFRVVKWVEAGSMRGQTLWQHLERLVSERRESGGSDWEARGQGCESLADKSRDPVGHGGCRR